MGKSIRIYLKDGTVSGIKLAEVVNHTIRALSCPRNKIAELNNHFSEEANRPGIYFLLGDDGTNRAKVYIGEAENVWDRLKNHDVKKDFWSEVVLFTSKDENLTKSHVKYIESRLINISNAADRYQLENSNSPTLSLLPLSDRDSMEDFILNIKLLTGTLGHKFLENPVSNSEDETVSIPLVTPVKINSIKGTSENLKLFLNIKDIRAEALQTDEGIVVMAGSLVSEKETKSYNYTGLREKLIMEGIIARNESHKLVFKKNYLFKNPSPAAAIILGYSVNGRNVWKNDGGDSLNDIEASKLN